MSCINVTMPDPMEQRFRVWLDQQGMTLQYIGDDSADTPQYVAVIKPGSALEQRFLAAAPHTKEENIEFRKDWDRRVEEGKS